MATISAAPQGRWARLPLAGRALLVFWGVVLLIVCAGSGVLAWLGPPPKPVKATAPITQHVVTARIENAPAVPAARPTPSPIPLPIPAPINGPHLAIVVRGFGYSATLTDRALATLPLQVGLMVSPYIAGLPDLIARARNAGHEVYLDLPVQGSSPDSTSIGPHGLGYGNGPADDIAALRWNLTRVPGITGVSVADTDAPSPISAPGFAATPDFAPIARLIDGRGLLVMVNGEQRPGLPRDLRADIRLGMDTDADTIDHALANIAERALHGEYVLVVTDTMTPVALTRLAAWLPELTQQGVALVAPSRMVAPDIDAPSPVAQDALPNASPS